MTVTARTTAPPAARPFDDDLAPRLLHQRIVVLGQEVDDAVANRGRARRCRWLRVCAER
ncbi:hypothetical protein [Cellulomonas fimi]|uniref:hypothetical protein n=1 Tax=Cellulomonas fimi TaxID=1708 RepID=UPI0027B93C87|nr:hypothetical protein [Cellulomonas fimi]